VDVSRDPFDRIMSSLDGPMIVVTAAAADERGGCLVGFHAQSSITPGRYSVWLSKVNHTYRVAQYATHLGVHFLSSSNRALAELFGTRSGDQIDKFAGRDVVTGPGLVPLLAECANQMAVRKVAVLDEGGDHVCVVTEPVLVRDASPFEPLMLSQLSGLRAGHPAEEREEPPTMRAP
jgi:flavin reductase (DIM6/NTAB) family NADH-FMN oxidoreductase RutF